MIPILVRILLIEDNPGDARLIQEIVKDFPNAGFELVHEPTLSRGIRRIENDDPFGIVLLDLGLPDSQGMSTFMKLRDQEFNLPILVLSGLSDEEIAIKAVQEGAQDYLVKGDVRPDLLYRAIRYAMERHQLQTELFAMSLIDPLTGLYNRRGFFKLARQEMKTAERLNHGLLLLFIDLDGMKAINDQYGHKEGDRALSQTAELLRKTFRESDILGRIGGDEFVVVALNADQDADRVCDRLRTAFQSYNENREHAYELSISIGFIRYPTRGAETLETLLEQADVMMYEEKQRKKSAR